jgi:hypothetical protein
MPCDLCDNEPRFGLQETELCGTAILVCPTCIERMNFHLLQVCSVCKSTEWISCDRKNEGFAYIILTCYGCNRRK